MVRHSRRPAPALVPLSNTDLVVTAQPLAKEPCFRRRLAVLQRSVAVGRRGWFLALV